MYKFDSEDRNNRDLLENSLNCVNWITIALPWYLSWLMFVYIKWGVSVTLFVGWSIVLDTCLQSSMHESEFELQIFYLFTSKWVFSS